MKKILLTIIMVLILTGPAMAGTPTLINGVGMNLDTVNVDNRLYLPLRTLGEALGMDVQWDGTFVRVNSAKRPIITGDANSINIINQALDLLKTSDPADYDLVCKYTKRIMVSTEQLNSQWGEADAKILEPDTCIIGPRILSNGKYLAATLVHESSHLCDSSNLLYERISSENKAYLRQISTLRILGASQQDIDDAERTRLRAIQ